MPNIMKTFLSLALFAGMSFAQSAQIGLPPADQRLEKGSDVIVQVQRPNSLTGSIEMAVAIGIAPCSSESCYPASSVMGTILYNGKFHPVYHEPRQPPYQNFTVKIPSDFASGRAHINIAHATLIGAGPFPYMEALNQTVTVV